MVAVLSSSPALYKPNAFGGATILDPWECLAEYNAKLKGDSGCDIVVPLCHLYEYQGDNLIGFSDPEIGQMDTSD